jgi:deoxyribodipyrimidine photolyase-related protein
LFADQLGPHFLDDPDQPVLLVEAKAAFRHRATHRQRAHLMLSALRHRAAELGDRAVLLRAETYRQALDRWRGPVEVCHPTSRAALRLVRGMGRVTVLPARGFVTDTAEFVGWADAKHGTLRVADWYRHVRQRRGILAEQVTGPDAAVADRIPARGARPVVVVPPPPPVEEDEIDEQVRHDLDRWAAEGIRFVGRDGPRRHPASPAEAERRLRHFVAHRLPAQPAWRDRIRAGDPLLAHSVLSSSFNLGLLDPADAVRRVELAYRAGTVPLDAADAFVRQLLGWREFLWHLYWYLEPGYRGGNWLGARQPLPDWFVELDADAVQARCLSGVLAQVRDRAWVHQTSRLMVLGNYALQRGWHPERLADWFRDSFVDGQEWIMNATVVGMSQYADLGRIASTPYAADGVYLDRVGDYCAGCRYVSRRRLGPDACPYTGGYLAFLDRNRDRLLGHPRTARAVRDLDRFDDLAAVAEQERDRGSTAP